VGNEAEFAARVEGDAVLPGVEKNAFLAEGNHTQ
jgi:hypothetical protein